MVEEFDEESSFNEDSYLEFDTLKDFINCGYRFGMRDAARHLRVPIRWIIEQALIRGWLFRKNPWSSLRGNQVFADAGLVTRRAQITASGLLILAASFDLKPDSFLKLGVTE